MKGKKGRKRGREEREEKARREKTLKYGVREGRKTGKGGNNKVEEVGNLSEEVNLEGISRILF